MIKSRQAVASICTNQCVKYGRSIKSRTVTIKRKLFYDIILIWSVNYTKSDKKLDTYLKRSKIP